MSALPILVMYKLLRVGLFTRIRDRELGLDRREPGLFYPTGYTIMIVVWFSTRGTVEYGLWLAVLGNRTPRSYAVWDNGWRPLKPETHLENDGLCTISCRIIYFRGAVRMVTQCRRHCVNEGPVSGGVALRPRPIEGQPCLLVSNIWNIFFSSGGDISLAYITP